MNLRLRRALAGALLSCIGLASVAACHDVVGQPTADEHVLTELRLHQYQWEQLGIHDYRYRYLEEDFMPPVGLPEEVIEVHGDTVTSVTDARADTVMHDPSAPTIPQLFSRISAMMDGHAADVWVGYDSSYAYPRVWGIPGTEVQYVAFGLKPISVGVASRLVEVQP